MRTHRYFRFRITWTSPLLLPSTFFPLVVSNPQKPIVFIISISSADFPSKSASETWTLSEILDFDDDANGERERCLLSNERDLLRDLMKAKLTLEIISNQTSRKMEYQKVSQKDLWLIHYTSKTDRMREGFGLTLCHSPRFSSGASSATRISIPVSTRRAYFSSFATFRSKSVFALWSIAFFCSLATNWRQGSAATPRTSHNLFEKYFWKIQNVCLYHSIAWNFCHNKNLIWLDISLIHYHSHFRHLRLTNLITEDHQTLK